MTKYITDLKPKTIKSIEMYSKEHEITEKHVIHEALDRFFENDYEEYFDDLYEKAVTLSIVYKNLNASVLQRELSVGYARARRLLKKLKDNGLII